MLKLDAEDSDGDDLDKPPTTQNTPQPVKQTLQTTENNTPANDKAQNKAADWNSAFLKSLNANNDVPPVEVS